MNPKDEAIRLLSSIVLLHQLRNRDCEDRKQLRTDWNSFLQVCGLDGYTTQDGIEAQLKRILQ